MTTAERPRSISGEGATTTAPASPGLDGSRKARDRIMYRIAYPPRVIVLNTQPNRSAEQIAQVSFSTSSRSFARGHANPAATREIGHIAPLRALASAVATSNPVGRACRHYDRRE